MEIKFNTHWITKYPDQIGNCTVMEVVNDKVTAITDWGNIVTLGKEEFLDTYKLNKATVEYEENYEDLIGVFPEDRLFRYKLEGRIALLEKALKIYGKLQGNSNV